MFINPNNIFIVRNAETYQLEHKINGDLEYIRDYTGRGDVVALVGPDFEIYYLPNVILRYPYRSRHTPSGGPDSFAGFRYDAKKQLELVRANPNINPSKWVPLSKIINLSF